MTSKGSRRMERAIAEVTIDTRCDLCKRGLHFDCLMMNEKGSCCCRALLEGDILL